MKLPTVQTCSPTIQTLDFAAPRQYRQPLATGALLACPPSLTASTVLPRHPAGPVEWLVHRLVTKLYQEVKESRSPVGIRTPNANDHLISAYIWFANQF